MLKRKTKKTKQNKTKKCISLKSPLQALGLYSPQNDPDPKMIPNPEMVPKSTQNDTDPEMIPN